MAIEKHFDLRFDDKELEQAHTVQQVADLVAKHRVVVPNGRDIRAEAERELLKALGKQERHVEDTVPFPEFCSGTKPTEVWSRWATSTLKMPELPPADRDRDDRPWLSRLVPKWMARRTISHLTFGQVLDGIIAHNHQTLIDPLRPGSYYEILMAVIGVSSDSIGVPELEIRPTDSYVSDLGVD